MKFTFSSKVASSLLLTTSLFAQNSKLAPDLANLDPNEPVDVIIQLNDPPPGRPGAPGRGRSLPLAGGLNLSAQRPVRELGIINGLAARIPAAALASLAADPTVKYISPDREVTPTLQFANPTTGAAQAFTAGWTGAGIGIAIIDSGVNNHPDLANATCTGNRVVYRQSFAPADKTVSPPDSFTTAPPDRFGHGTHVAVIAAGNGKCAPENKGQLFFSGGTAGPAVRFTGVAQAADIIDLKVLNNEGRGNDSAVIAAIDRAIALKAIYNIRVINLSLGRAIRESYAIDPLCQAVERAWVAGITVVVSAGNLGRTRTVTGSNGSTYQINGYGTIGSPGNHPFAITVGAMNDRGTAGRADDLITTYTSRGPTGIDRVVKPDLVAPGNKIFSAFTAGAAVGNRFPGNRTRSGTSFAGSAVGAFIELSGTSMATPMVSGAVALLVHRFGAAVTPDTLKAKLMKSASKTLPSVTVWTDPSNNITYTSQYDALTVGAGYLDITAALNNVDTAAAGKRAVSPTINWTCGPSLVKLSGCVSVVHGANSVFTTAAASGVWANRTVWGGSVLVGDSVLWGDSVVWGDTTASGHSLLWGDSLIWGDSVLWGDQGGFARPMTIMGQGDSY